MHSHVAKALIIFLPIFSPTLSLTHAIHHEAYVHEWDSRSANERERKSEQKFILIRFGMKFNFPIGFCRSIAVNAPMWSKTKLVGRKDDNVDSTSQQKMDDTGNSTNG